MHPRLPRRCHYLRNGRETAWLFSRSPPVRWDRSRNQPRLEMVFHRGEQSRGRFGEACDPRPRMAREPPRAV